MTRKERVGERERGGMDSAATMDLTVEAPHDAIDEKKKKEAEGKREALARIPHNRPQVHWDADARRPSTPSPCDTPKEGHGRHALPSRWWERRRKDPKGTEVFPHSEKRLGRPERRRKRERMTPKTRRRHSVR